MSNLEKGISLFVENKNEDCAQEFIGVLRNENLYEIVDIFWDLCDSCPDPLGIALHDIVEALPCKDKIPYATPSKDGELYITRIVKKSGYKILTLMARARSATFSPLTMEYGEVAQQFCKKLTELECTWLCSMASFWLVHIPPHIKRQTILNYIEDEKIPMAIVRDMD